MLFYNFIVYQSIGIVALIIGAVSFQIKNNRYFLLLQCLSCALFGVQFLICKAWAGFLLNCVCVFRCLLFAFIENKKARKIATVFLSIAFAAAGVLSVLIFKGELWVAILTSLASIVGAISIATDNEKIIRYVQIGFVSPCWLANNIYFLSIGGIVSECLNIVSASIALLRWRKKKN